MKKLTSAGGVIVYKDKILLLKKERTWVFPKGKVKEGEKLIETAIREIYEETGIEVKKPLSELGIIKYRYSSNNEKFEKCVNYYLFIVDNFSINLEDGFIGYGWFYFDEALKIITYKNDKKILKLAIKKIRETQKKCLP